MEVVLDHFILLNDQNFSGIAFNELAYVFGATLSATNCSSVSNF